MALTFPLTLDGLEVDVLINREAAVLFPMWQMGVHPPPLPGRGLIDTGNDITGVSQSILQQLGISAISHATTHGIGGSAAVNIYRISLSIVNASNLNLPWLPHPTLDVMELPPTIPFAVLIGLDILRACKLFLDGPGNQFTLDL